MVSLLTKVMNKASGCRKSQNDFYGSLFSSTRFFL
jgi:hypothetical protein